SMNMLSVDGYNLMVKYMTMLNREGRDAIVPHKPTACTDVTGFGLLGHLSEMAEGSNVTIELNSKEVPLIDGAYEFALEDIFPGGAYKNLAYVKNKFTAENIPQVMIDILCDPQTSGGLMASMSETDAIELCKEYKDAKIIARVLEKGEKSIIII
ncbi:MAG: AIR synthase-related protein, partial [Oscillospiraceae bacterium]